MECRIRGQDGSDGGSDSEIWSYMPCCTGRVGQVVEDGDQKMEKLSPVLMAELFELVKLKAHTGFVVISTEELAERMGQSQQAASQHLQRLEKAGMIERRRTGLRFAVKLTQNGFDLVTSQYAQ